MQPQTKTPRQTRQATCPPAQTQVLTATTTTPADTRPSNTAGPPPLRHETRAEVRTSSSRAEQPTTQTRPRPSTKTQVQAREPEQAMETTAGMPQQQPRATLAATRSFGTV
eukprot:3648608-Rhodomonas_salina.1